MSDISTKGFVLLKQALTKDQLEYGLSSDTQGTLDYKRMKNFIDIHFLPTISGKIERLKRPTYLKFRYSNNNNSTDASTFHSDVYDFTTGESMPIYTCLCYFDRTQMEIIPGSHLRSFRESHTSVGSFFSKEVITIEPGDLLIFHANIHHRGIQFDTEENRRLLQVFEVFPDDKTFAEHYPLLLTVLTSSNFATKCLNQGLYVISKIPPVINTLNFFHYILVYNDMQYKVNLMDLPPWEKTGTYISYEPGSRMEYAATTGQDPINVNIVVNDTHAMKPSPFYALFYMLYWIVSLLVFYYIGKWLYRNKSVKSITRGKTLRKFTSYLK